MKQCSESDQQDKFLGISKKELIEMFGEPSMTYRHGYQNRETLHYGRPDLSFVEIMDGVVTRYETLPDCRASFRVRPSSPTRVRIVTRHTELDGLMVDLSMTGMRVSLTEHYDFSEAEELFLCFSTNSDDGRETVSVPGTFYRVLSEDGALMVIVLFNSCGTAVQHQLQNYIRYVEAELLSRNPAQ